MCPDLEIAMKEVSSPSFPPRLYALCELPRICSYLPEEKASLEYRGYRGLSPTQLEALLSRGWRRFGIDLFRPACQTCSQCIPLRVNVAEFRTDKSQRRTARKNAHVQVTLHEPGISDEHIALYNAWHGDMAARKDWPPQRVTRHEYLHSFLAGDFPSFWELQYRMEGKLIGVGLIDCLPHSLSSIYFYHAPHWRSQSPGTFSLLCEIALAREMGLDYVYLGYWIRNCGSMAYKSCFHPHELLQARPEDGELPAWLKRDAESYNVPSFKVAESSHHPGDPYGPADND